MVCAAHYYNYLLSFHFVFVLIKSITFPLLYFTFITIYTTLFIFFYWGSFFIIIERYHIIFRYSYRLYISYTILIIHVSCFIILIDQSHRYGRPQAACREPAGSYDKTTRTAICFEHKTQYLLIRAPYTRFVVFWHISNIPPMISQSQIPGVKLVVIPPRFI